MTDIPSKAQLRKWKKIIDFADNLRNADWRSPSVILAAKTAAKERFLAFGHDCEIPSNFSFYISIKCKKCHRDITVYRQPSICDSGAWIKEREKSKILRSDIKKIQMIVWNNLTEEQRQTEIALYYLVNNQP
jgi:hypothetical protein